MHTFVFRCPLTGYNVQGRVDTMTEDLPERSYMATDCVACRSMHLINPRTGKLMSEETERPRQRT